MSYQLGSVHLTKWQLALLVGTPLTVGLGVFIYRKAVAKKGKDRDISNKKNLIKGRELKQPATETVEATPLKEAIGFKNEGNICYRTGKYDEAIAFYDKAIEQCPPENHADLAICYQNRAAAYEMLKKWADVKSDCTSSLKHNPRYAKAFFRRAKAYEATNDLIACLNDVTATCILEMFQNNNTIIYADRILKQTGRNDMERNLKTRVNQLPSNNFIKTYLNMFVADPLAKSFDLPDLTPTAELRGYIRARRAMQDQKYEDIIPACTEEIESSEAESQYTAEARLLRGVFYMLSAAYTEAIQDLTAVIDNTNADNSNLSLRTSALIRRASVHIQMEDMERGLKDFDEAEKLEPSNPDIYHQRAQIFILLDQLPEAINQFEKTVNLSPEHATAFVQKCYAEYRQCLMTQDSGRLLQVMNQFYDAVEKYPECVECFSLLAQVLSDQQKYPQADELYAKAIKLSPGNAALFVHRGILLLQWKGDIGNAMELIKQALEVDDKCMFAYETLGTIEVQRANLDRAVELFNTAIKLAKAKQELCHLYSLRNAALAQIEVTKQLGINMSTISEIAHAMAIPPTGTS